MDKPKGLLIGILGKKEKSSGGSELDSAWATAFSDFTDAQKRGDASAAKDAFQRMKESCYEDDESGDTDEDSESKDDY